MAELAHSCVRWFVGATDDDGRFRKADTFLAALLLAVGALHWMWFFGFGAIRDDSHDWPRAFAYYDVLRSAVASGSIPFHTNVAFQGTTRFMAVPETLASPQVLLLPFLSNGQFALVQVLLLYAAGFWGTLLLRRAFGWSPAALVAFWLLFNFNGHITAHLAVGHMMWAAYFLLPLFFLFVQRVAHRTGEGEPVQGAGLALGLVMAAILLQGGLHLYVYCILFVLLLVGFKPRTFRAGGLALVGSGLAGCFRLAPAAISFWKHEHAFDSGYPSGWTLFQALVRIRPYRLPRIGGTLGVSYWWEYDLFIGMIALVFLLVFGLKYGFAVQHDSRRASSFGCLGGPALVLGVLAMGDLYAALGALPLPLVDVERCASRFMIMPFVVLLAESTSALSRSGTRWKAKGAGTVLALMVVTAWELYLHSYRWAIPRIQSDFPAVRIRPAFAVRASDPLYMLIFFAGCLVSLLAFAVIVRKLYRDRIGTA